MTVRRKTNLCKTPPSRLCVRVKKRNAPSLQKPQMTPHTNPNRHYRNASPKLYSLAWPQHDTDELSRDPEKWAGYTFSHRCLSLFKHIMRPDCKWKPCLHSHHPRSKSHKIRDVKKLESYLRKKKSSTLSFMAIKWQNLSLYPIGPCEKASMWPGTKCNATKQVHFNNK